MGTPRVGGLGRLTARADRAGNIRLTFATLVAVILEFGEARS